MFARNLYYSDQLIVLEEGLDPTNKEFGDISDIDPRIHSSEELEWFSMSRGSNYSYGNIEDFIGKSVSYYVLEAFCRSRGNNPHYGSIEDFLGKDIPSKILTYVSLGRGTCEEYGNVDDLVSPTVHVDVIWAGLITRTGDPQYPNIDHLLKTNLNGKVMLVISRGLGDNSIWGDISKYPHLDKLEEHHANYLSLGLGISTDYVNVWDVSELWLLTEAEFESVNNCRKINTINLSA